MTRPDIVQLFYRNLIVDGAGRYFIRLRSQTYPVDVEDTPFVVRDIVASLEETAFLMKISDGSEEKLDPETFRIGENNVPYCAIRSGLYRARLSKTAYYRLAERLHHDPEQDLFYLELNGLKFHLGSDHDKSL